MGSQNYESKVFGCTKISSRGRQKAYKGRKKLKRWRQKSGDLLFYLFVFGDSNKIIGVPKVSAGAPNGKHG